MDKYKIEKNTVQETLVIPLYGRRLCSRMFPTLFQDKSAAELMERIDYDFSALEKQSNSLMQVFGALEVAMRQSDLAWEVGDYLKSHPKAAVINLGCGLDNTGRSCGNLALDLNEPAWMGAIDVNPADGTVLFAAGVFYYFTTKQVQHFVTSMAERFPGGRLVFDGAGKTAVKLMLKTWVKQAGIKDVGAYFSVKDAKGELERWSPLLSVSSRGYMQGYRKLEGPGVRPIHRLLAKIADGPLHLQIVRVEFKEVSR